MGSAPSTCCHLPPVCFPGLEKPRRPTPPDGSLSPVPPLGQRLLAGRGGCALHRQHPEPTTARREPDVGRQVHSLASSSETRRRHVDTSHLGSPFTVASVKDGRQQGGGLLTAGAGDSRGPRRAGGGSVGAHRPGWRQGSPKGGFLVEACWKSGGGERRGCRGHGGEGGGHDPGQGSRCCKTAGLLDPALPRAGPGVTVMRGSPELPVHLNRCEKRPGRGAGNPYSDGPRSLPTPESALWGATWCSRRPRRMRWFCL